MTIAVNHGHISFYRMASIKQTLCVYSEAIEEYKLILEKSPNYVPALKGLYCL